MTLNLALATIATSLLAAAMGAPRQPGAPETPFFCNLKALTAAERAEHRAVTARVLAGITSIRELPAGYAFELSPSITIKDLATWVDFERRCCPFFDVQLTWPREHGAVTLQLTGREGVKTFMQAEFASLFRE